MARGALDVDGFLVALGDEDGEIFWSEPFDKIGWADTDGRVKTKLDASYFHMGCVLPGGPFGEDRIAFSQGPPRVPKENNAIIARGDRVQAVEFSPARCGRAHPRGHAASARASPTQILHKSLAGACPPRGSAYSETH